MNKNQSKTEKKSATLAISWKINTEKNAPMSKHHKKRHKTDYYHFRPFEVKPT